ncbi:hypothetical protein C8J38_10736 [Rhizobium sp. PP-WC-2G-219]|nr:hypothetical protein C8J38_10736 [Rhizobium sp. PP-WC-2G-219]
MCSLDHMHGLNPCLSKFASLGGNSEETRDYWRLAAGMSVRITIVPFVCYLTGSEYTQAEAG